jgi:hypothetical protein
MMQRLTVWQITTTAISPLQNDLTFTVVDVIDNVVDFDPANSDDLYFNYYIKDSDPNIYYKNYVFDANLGIYAGDEKT